MREPLRPHGNSQALEKAWKLLHYRNYGMQALRAAILLLDALVHEWLEILEEGGVPSSLGGPPGSPPPAPDLARLEGFAVCFLCSTDPDVRRSSWDLLSSVRRLHSSLTSAGKTADRKLDCRHFLLYITLTIARLLCQWHRQWQGASADNVQFNATNIVPLVGHARPSKIQSAGGMVVSIFCPRASRAAYRRAKIACCEVMIACAVST